MIVIFPGKIHELVLLPRESVLTDAQMKLLDALMGQVMITSKYVLMTGGLPEILVVTMRLVV
jgi:hypothetical protein